MKIHQLILPFCLAAIPIISTQAQSDPARGDAPASADRAPDPASQGTGKPEASTQKDTASKPTPDAKKVWTNEDLNGIHSDPAISTFAKPASSKPNKPPSKQGASNGKNAKWYQDQIAKLKAQIPPLEKQIAELQDAIAGKAPGDGKRSTRPYSVKIDDWQAELDQDQNERADISSKIDALRDEARHNGIPAKDIP
jgi:hypothetical protein